MNLFRAIILVSCTTTLGGAGWLAANGVWSEDSDALTPRSLRTDSTGNAIGSSSVK